MPRTTRAFAELKDLVKITARLVPARFSIPTKEQLDNSTATYARLYRLISSRPEEGEFYASSELLGLKPTDTRYRVERARLKNLLFRTLYFLNYEEAGFSLYATQLYELRRNVFLVGTLRNLGCRLSAEKLAMRSLDSGLKLEEFGLSLEVLSTLRTYAALASREEDLLSFTEQSSVLHLQMKAEFEAEAAMQRIQVAFAHSGSEKPDLKEYVINAAQVAQERATSLGGFKLSFAAIRLRALASQVELNYDEALGICDEADRLLNSYPQFDNRVRRAEFAMKRLMCYIQTREYEAAKQTLKHCERLVNRAESSWFSLKELEYLLLMHTNQFQDALAICEMVRLDQRFHAQPQLSVERWDLFSLYAEYVNHKPIPLSQSEEFLTYLPGYSSDKAGFNVSLLVLHILLLLESGDYNAVADRIEALKIYRKRYLRSKEGEQASLFFRLLFLLIRADFDLTKVVARSTILLNKEPEALSNVIVGLQILPFDWIWSRILVILESPKRVL